MTAEEFNALPLEVRRFIESKMSCASCGGRKDLDFHYQQYIQMEQTSLYTLRNGAVRSEDSKTKEVKILYPISATDSQDAKKEKFSLALKINAVKPDAFQFIDAEAIEGFLDRAAKAVEEDDLIGDTPKAKKK